MMVNDGMQRQIALVRLGSRGRFPKITLSLGNGSHYLHRRNAYRIATRVTATLITAARIGATRTLDELQQMMLLHMLDLVRQHHKLAIDFVQLTPVKLESKLFAA
jgi:hypothetical protein